MYSVKQARLLAEKTQEEMAEMMGMHVQTYRKLEQNPNKFTFEQGYAIAEITGISISEIFFGTPLPMVENR